MKQHIMTILRESSTVLERGEALTKLVEYIGESDAAQEVVSLDTYNVAVADFETLAQAYDTLWASYASVNTDDERDIETPELVQIDTEPEQEFLSLDIDDVKIAIDMTLAFALHGEPLEIG